VLFVLSAQNSGEITLRKRLRATNYDKSALRSCVGALRSDESASNYYESALRFDEGALRSDDGALLP